MRVHGPLCSVPSGESAITLRVSVHPLASAADLQLSASRLPAEARLELTAERGEAILSIRSGRSEAVCSAAMWAAAHEEVVWVERRRRAAFGNLFAAMSVMSGATTPSTELWDRGLHGEGQIVGIGDTGIDHDNCFFNDPRRPVPINKVDSEHRKIVAYWADSDAQDEVDGHGTHVAGSAVGQTTSADAGTARINGIAWAAKIVFTDVDPATIPGNMDGPYFNRPYAAGARVHCDSWGSESNVYDLRAQSLDRFADLHRDFLSVTAAGACIAAHPRTHSHSHALTHSRDHVLALTQISSSQ